MPTPQMLRRRDCGSRCIPKTTWSTVDRVWRGSKPSGRVIHSRCTASVCPSAQMPTLIPTISRASIDSFSDSSRSSCPNISRGLPGTVSTVRICCRSRVRTKRCNVLSHNIQRTQDTIKRAILIENPSHYLAIPGHDYDEIEFLTELCRRTGCGLLLDVNNVYVSANNLGFDANAYLDAFPGQYVAELHLAGHCADPNLGNALLIDSHDAPVSAAVWQLYARLIARIGPRPTLIERDDELPAFDVLLAERNRADCLLRAPVACR